MTHLFASICTLRVYRCREQKSKMCVGGDLSLQKSKTKKNQRQHARHDDVLNLEIHIMMWNSIRVLMKLHWEYKFNLIRFIFFARQIHSCSVNNILSNCIDDARCSQRSLQVKKIYWKIKLQSNCDVNDFQLRFHRTRFVCEKISTAHEQNKCTRETLNEL